MDLDETLVKALSDTFEDHAGVLKNPGATITPGEDPIARDAVVLLQDIARGEVAPFEPGDTIGEGGMGLVRSAKQLALGRDVAVKTLRESVVGTQASSHILREAWVTGMLEHPNIVPVYDISLDENRRPQIALKKIEGESWEQLARDAGEVMRRFAATDLLEWNLRVLLQVMNAIAFAHSRGIVHRDVKPENVMIGEFGEVYVVDWGIAVSLHEENEGRLPMARDARQMAGTPCYMAPEMLGGEAPSIDERTDVYLLGAVLYELIEGHAPHIGDTFQMLVGSIVTSTPRFRTDAQPELVGIVRRAMSAEKDDRYGSVRELARAIEGYLSHQGSRRLAIRAEARLDELTRLRGHTPEEYELVQHAFNEACFGFRAALVEWEANPIAKRGLTKSAERMARLELARDNPEGAAVALRASPNTSRELQGAVDQAVRDHRQESKRLSQLGQDMDVDTGRRTRSFLAVMFGLSWIILPLIGWYLEQGGREFVPREYMYPPLGMLAVLFVFTIWARESMLATRLNRAVIMTVAYVFAAQAVLAHLAGSVGIGMAGATVLFMGVWSAVVTTMVVTLEPRLKWAALGYAIIIWLVPVMPAHRQLLVAASHLILMLNMLAVWTPWGNLRSRNAEET